MSLDNTDLYLCDSDIEVSKIESSGTKTLVDNSICSLNANGICKVN